MDIRGISRDFADFAEGSGFRGPRNRALDWTLAMAFPTLRSDNIRIYSVYCSCIPKPLRVQQENEYSRWLVYLPPLRC
jgi:hypothetical protein